VKVLVRIRLREKCRELSDHFLSLGDREVELDLLLSSTAKWFKHPHTNPALFAILAASLTTASSPSLAYRCVVSMLE